MANTTNGCFAATAASYLRASGFTNEVRGGDSAEIERQCDCIVKWANAEHAMLTPACYTGLKKFAKATAEHEVYHRDSDNRALKITHSGCFGVTPEPKGIQKAATPAFYLHRIQMMNEVFRSDIRLEGLLMRQSFLIGATGDKPSFVISQPWLLAADTRFPYPNDLEIADFMEKIGFKSTPGSYFGWSKGNITVIDARIDNFIKTAEGVVPIDLVICRN